ncbi:uncharacterized protein LACBIDRAFT_322517 [Laccaria bicolor S238N-H82]|uniref:Predicted protein n=1 Tax=Laccaria bicolor (strain S238N-H82 / ATCC MYA-4686) TaxID=486041 RepID=B0CWK4_LACBS|nr:uncharacterized protein LACBIDRAFT_322517 [Laccaria bicolor S238N-H82]EDR13526.1 predicted protein [Laccaria bicolor S238N-H82]|eukprot:XP_001876024.1 predicted protein [Laccaria bicolor S238N-H82]
MSIEDAAGKAVEDLLLKQTAAVLSGDTILQLFLSVQQNHLSLSMQHAIERSRGLISYVRVMFSSVWTSETSEKNETTLVRSILNYFPHTLIDNILFKQNPHGVNDGPSTILCLAQNGLVWCFEQSSSTGQ